MEKHERFLEFNGKNIVFISVDGVYHIALRAICEALQVDFVRCFKNAKSDPILGPVLSDQTIQVEKNGKKQGRKMTCIPEKFVYGWLFSLRSDSPELTSYKKTCYDLLYNHFHGTITNRKELLLERSMNAEEMHQLEMELREDERYKQLELLKSKNKRINSNLGVMDKELIKQPELFTDN